MMIVAAAKAQVAKQGFKRGEEARSLEAWEEVSA